MGCARFFAWGGKYSLRKAVNPFNRPFENSGKWAYFRRFTYGETQTATLGNAASRPETGSWAASALHLSLPHGLLVNKRRRASALVRAGRGAEHASGEEPVAQLGCEVHLIAFKEIERLNHIERHFHSLR